jgi:hypothetical protein
MSARLLHEPRWQRLRFALGIAQMAGATFALALLVTTGVTPVTLYAAVLTTLGAAVSILLFGGRHSRR